MKTNPKISVIMAAYNNGDVIGEAIESILNQSFKDFELLIINDNSKDNTESVIKGYLNLDNRIRYFKNTTNKGAAATRNIGIKHAKGKYIAILDGDDIAYNNRLKFQYDFLEKNPDYFLIGSGAEQINYNGKHIKYIIPKVRTYKEIKNFLPYNNCFIHSSVMFRNKNLYYREKFLYSQDYDLFLNILSSGYKMYNFKNVLVKWRINPNGISSTKIFYQEIFSNVAKTFYRQRLKYGKDDYDTFSLQKILDEGFNNRYYFEAYIYMNYKRKEYKSLLNNTIKYIKKFGINKKIFKYLIFSILINMIYLFKK